MYPSPAPHTGYDALSMMEFGAADFDLDFLAELPPPPVAAAPPSDFGYTPSIAEVVFGSAAAIPLIHSDEHGTRPTVRGLKWIGVGSALVGAMIGFTLFDTL